VLILPPRDVYTARWVTRHASDRQDHEGGPTGWNTSAALAAQHADSLIRVAADDDAQTSIDASLARLCTRVTAHLLGGGEGTLCFYCARAPASWRPAACGRCHRVPVGAHASPAAHDVAST
jgi:hypothetical protein